MKLKGIPIWEQHIEKIVLGVVVLFAGFFAVTQFLGPGNSIELNNETVRPGSLDARLLDEAKRIDARLSSTNVAIDLPEPEDLSETVRQRARGSVSGTQELALLGYPSFLGALGADLLPKDKEFVVPEFGAPTDIMVASYSGAIEETVLEQYPELREKLESFHASGDIAFTSVLGMINAKDMRDQLRKQPEGDEKLPIPPLWFNDRLYVVDLVMEREELVNGQWQDRQVIAIPDGFLTFRRLLIADDPTSEERLEMLNELNNQAAQAEIIQPAFYPMKGAQWIRPEPRREGENLGEDMFQALEYRAQIRTLDLQIEQLSQRLDEIGGPLDPPDDEDRGNRPNRPTQPPGGGGGGGGMLGGGGGGGMDLGGGGSGDEGNAEDRRKEANDRNRIRMTARLRQFESTRDRIQQRLDDLVREKNLVLDAGQAAWELPDLQTDEFVPVWGHDIFVKPRSVYRYRMHVEVYNPFFGKNRQLMESQAQLAEKLSIASATSSWSPPVRIPDNTRYFVTSGAAANQASGAGNATVEVYRMKDGQWFVQSFNVSPGDPIGREIRRSDMSSIDFRTGAYMLDVVSPIGEGGSGMPGRSSKSDVYIVTEAGETVRRDPERDMLSLERLRLKAMASPSSP